MRSLILTHRHERRPVDDHIGGLQKRIAEKPEGVEIAIVELLLLALERRNALQPGQRCDHRQKEVQLGVLFHFRLQKNRRLVRIEPGGQPIGDGVERRLADLGRIGVVGRQSVPVGDKEVAGITILQLHPVAHRSEVVAQMHAAGRP